MSRIVFWDTSAFFFFFNTRDALHGQAVAVSQSLARENAQLLTTDAVLTELANGLSKVGQRQLAQRTVKMVYQFIDLDPIVVHAWTMDLPLTLAGNPVLTHA